MIQQICRPPKHPKEDITASHNFFARRLLDDAFKGGLLKRKCSYEKKVQKEQQRKAWSSSSFRESFNYESYSSGVGTLCSSSSYGSPLAFLYMMDEELMIVCGQKKQGLAL